MSAIPKPITSPHADSGDVDSIVNGAFLKLMPAVETHAKIQFRHLREHDREEAIAEAKAAAFVNYRQACGNGKSHRITPGTLANYAVLHAASGRRVGGGQDSSKDVLSPRAQRLRGFKVRSLGWQDHVFDCMVAPDQPVWRENLLDDKSTPILDQVRFRRDWSSFMATQTDRTRKVLGMLAAGHTQVEVADTLGLSPAAICQRRTKARREWESFQGEI